MSVTRRDILKLISAGSLALGLPNMSFLFAGSVPKPDIVAITGEDLAANVKEAIKLLGGMGRFVSKGDKVVLKPNMGFANKPIKATTTDPRVVRAVAELALEAGAKRIMVLDYPCHSTDIAIDTCEVKGELSKLEDTFVYAIENEKFFREVNIPQGKELKKARIAFDVLEADCLINIPIAKSHSSTYVSFSMKNWMGIVKDRRSWHVLIDLNQAIADLATFMKPKLTVVDANRVLLTGGPSGPGRIIEPKTVIAGVDPLAVDVFSLALAPWGGKWHTPEQVPHIRNAIAHGIGNHDLSALNILKKTI